MVRDTTDAVIRHYYGFPGVPRTTKSSSSGHIHGNGDVTFDFDLLFIDLALPIFVIPSFTAVTFAATRQVITKIIIASFIMDQFQSEFIFSRASPWSSDYEMVLGIADKLDASLSYKTVRDGWTIRLYGFLKFREPKDFNVVIALLPNFLVQRLGPLYSSGLEWLKSISANDNEAFFLDGDIVTYVNRCSDEDSLVQNAEDRS